MVEQGAEEFDELLLDENYSFSLSLERNRKLSSSPAVKKRF